MSVCHNSNGPKNLKFFAPSLFHNYCLFLIGSMYHNHMHHKKPYPMLYIPNSSKSHALLLEISYPTFF
uniref:Putative ovule protein n=1 Tax=Solanum chacoense TaxID=4108 RepID=A0A0V0GNS9_SOLCH